MSALLFLFACLALGAVVSRFARPPAGLAQGLNWWVLNIALPALVLEQIPRLDLDPDLWFPAAGPWVVFLGAWLLFPLLGRLFDWSRQRVGALILTCGLGNTSFMGYPMVHALRGPEALGPAVIADQLGCFLALSTGGILVAALYAGRQPRVAQIARQVLLFPAFLALLLGVMVGASGGWPPAVEGGLHRLGQTLTPLALFSVGLQFHLRGAGERLGPIAAGLSWKLALAPLAVYGIGTAAGVGSGLVFSVAVLQSAMAPMISAGILAQQSGLEPRLANTVVGVGILVALVSVPLWSIVFLPP